MLQGQKQLQLPHSITNMWMSCQTLTALLSWQREVLRKKELDQKLKKPHQELPQHPEPWLPTEKMGWSWQGLATGS